MLIRSLYDLIRVSWGGRSGIWVYRAVKIFLNIFYPVYCGLVPYRQPAKSAPLTIVSLTSFPARIERLWLVIETLLRQTSKPHKIVLWLAVSQFDGVASLPKSLRRLEKRGLEIKFCDDLRSHKKYFYAMQEFPTFSVITVDDDTFYPEDLVEGLVDCSQEYPGLVCCYLAHQMVFRDGSICKYLDWISGFQTQKKYSSALVPIGCEGVLYPPEALDQRAFDKWAIITLCPFADDLWLKAMSTLNERSTVRVHSRSHPFANLIYSRKAMNVSLSELNNGEAMNDLQLAAIVSKYPELIGKWRSG
jgi:hypothetical protein